MAVAGCAVSLFFAASAGAVTEFVSAPGSPIDVGSPVFQVATGDFNGDGHQDIAAVYPGSVHILLGDGTGGFHQAPTVPVQNALWAAVGDLNGDGHQDIAVAGGDNGVPAYHVLLGHGDGTFKDTGPVDVTGDNPISIAIGKLNNDAYPDLVMLTGVNSDGSTLVHVLLGDGNGGFTEPNSPTSGGNREGSSVAVGKLNGDAYDDVVVSGTGGFSPNFNYLGALLSDGAGNLTAASGSPFSADGNGARVAVLGDFDNDGKTDLAVSNEQNDNIGIRLGNGDGTFTAPLSSPVAVGQNPYGLAAGDVNGDGNQDLVVGDDDSNAVDLLLGDGSGGFLRSSTGPFPTGAINAPSVALADFNEDGKLDAVVATNSGPAIMLYHERLPAAPTISGTNPASPSQSTSFRVTGSAEGPTTQLYTGPACNTPLSSGPTTFFSSPGFLVNVPPDSTTTLSAETTDAQGTSSCSAPITYTADETPPSPPTLSATVPSSPGNDTTPGVQGAAESGSSVEIYDNSGCGGSPIGTASEAQLANGTLTVTVPADASTTLYATATDAAGNQSGCSSAALTYVEDSTPPAAPTGLGTLPASPSNDAQPQVTGSAEAGSTVRIYTTASCSGPPAATGTAAALGAGGIPVNLSSDGTTTFRATATDAAGNLSPCSASSVSYTLDTTPPPAPVLSGTDPASPSNVNQVSIRGLAQPGSTVSLFANGKCSGPALISGTAAALASPGLQLFVAVDSSTTFSALATDAVGNTSPCSTPLTFVEDSRPPETFLDGLHVSRKHRATASFSSDDPGATFACRIDRRPFGRCTSPLTTGRLSPGRHVFQVVAMDTAGNSDPTPASRTLVVHRR